MLIQCCQGIVATAMIELCYELLCFLKRFLFSEFINLLTTEEIPDQELFEIFSAFDCDGKSKKPGLELTYSDP